MKKFTFPFYKKHFKLKSINNFNQKKKNIFIVCKFNGQLHQFKFVKK